MDPNFIHVKETFSEVSLAVCGRRPRFESSCTPETCKILGIQASCLRYMKEIVPFGVTIHLCLFEYINIAIYFLTLTVTLISIK